MRLYLVQHGQAKTEDEDPLRPLTDQGVEDVVRVAHLALGHIGVGPGRVVHSGKTRARQTAEIWSGLIGCGVEEADELGPNDDPTVWGERLQETAHDLMVVGHLPHLGRLAGLLLTGAADRPVVRFRPGGLVALERTDAGWTVGAVLPPDGL